MESSVSYITISLDSNCHRGRKCITETYFIANSGDRGDGCTDRDWWAQV